ncbi:MAG: DUF3084 domain-containing protein [Synechococcus sp.]
MLVVSLAISAVLWGGAVQLSSRATPVSDTSLSRSDGLATQFSPPLAPTQSLHQRPSAWIAQSIDEPKLDENPQPGDESPLTDGDSLQIKQPAGASILDDRNEAKETPEIITQEPSRWQRMQGVLFVFYILVLSGVIATVGDRLGYRIGKKRLSWFNMRPRHTAIVITILTGIIISASSVGVLLLTNEAIRDALFRYGERVNEFQSTILMLEGNIDSIQGQLSNLETERLAAETKVEQLTNEQAQLRQQQQVAEAALLNANQELEAASQRLSEAQASLNAARQETQQAESEAASARARVDELQSSLQDTESELSELQSQKSNLEMDIANLTTVADRLRRGEFAVLAGEPMATGVIEGGMTSREIQQGLNTLFAIAERRARALGASPENAGGRAIQIRVPEVTRTIQAVSSPGSWVVQVYSLTNRLVGEPVPVITGVIPNRLLFTEGTVLAETAVSPGGSDEDIEATLVRLFLEAGQLSRSKGIVFNSSSGTVGEFSQSRLFELVQTLRRIDEPQQVQVVAQRDIYTSGPLEVDLVSSEIQSTEGSSTFPRPS